MPWYLSGIIIRGPPMVVGVALCSLCPVGKRFTSMLGLSLEDLVRKDYRSWGCLLSVPTGVLLSIYISLNDVRPIDYVICWCDAELRRVILMSNGYAVDFKIYQLLMHVWQVTEAYLITVRQTKKWIVQYQYT